MPDALHRNRFFLLTGVFFAVLFGVLLGLRLDLFEAITMSPPGQAVIDPASAAPSRDTWMSVIQNDQKIGFAHSTFSDLADGYRLEETLFMRLNTLGMVQDVRLHTVGRLEKDFTLAAVSFELRSGLFRFAASGHLAGDALRLNIDGPEGGRLLKIPVKDKPYLGAGILDALHAADLDPGARLQFTIFDPATMSAAPVDVQVIGPETIRVMETEHRATRIALDFKGSRQLAWIDSNGEILKQSGLLGINLVKTSREWATRGIAAAPQEDLLEVASIPSNVTLKDPAGLQSLRVRITGLSPQETQLHGGRQELFDDVLVVRKESEAGLPDRLDLLSLDEADRAFLEPTPFIQSDHAKIWNLTVRIVHPEDTPLLKARRLVAWVYENIEKRPVLSLPDALTTLGNGVGDCNEHAVLLAALARAANIPAKVEAGLVYMNGRFYYHAWTLLYVGRWITADATMGQMPADVTHIRLASGSADGQLDLMRAIGRIRLQILT